MKCQFCSNPATMHLTTIINRKKRETHVCDACAEERNILPGKSSEMPINALLQFVLGSNPGIEKESDETACPECGLKYAQFRSEGRLGCPHDYEVFKERLEPLLLKIHRSQNHVGKVPASLHSARQAQEMQNFRNQLLEAVTRENYEEAARLRDLIRSKEQLDETR